MKLLLILAFTIGSTITFGQTPTTKASNLSSKSKNELGSDTSLKVIYANNESQINKPACFLNGKFIGQTLLATLNPTQIESINVVKGAMRIDNIQYYGQIHIKTKSGYNPKLISLSDLKDKYTNLKNKSVVFMIDGSIINADYDSCLVDESYLLTIIVDNIENSKENINLDIIKLLTKSDENIKKSKKIRIRGTEVVTNK